MTHYARRHSIELFTLKKCFIETGTFSFSHFPLFAAGQFLKRWITKCLTDATEDCEIFWCS